MRNKAPRYLASLCTICLISAILILTQSQPLAQENPELTIFAAASLTNVFDDLAQEFSDQYQIDVTTNYGGSSTLVAQLLQGAEADIFASANEMQMQILVDEGLVETDSVKIFAENELIIIVPSDNPANIQTAKDLAQANILLVFAAPDVPIRTYTDILLKTLAPLYGDFYVESVLGNVVSEETNVRQVLARVLLGEADAGIVYRSDVTPDIVEEVQVIKLPAGTSPRAVYPIAPLNASIQSEDSALFIRFVLSDEGQAILEKWGFCSVQDLTIEATPELTPEAVEKNDDASQSCEGDA